MELRRTINGVTTVFQLKDEIVIPACHLRNGTVLKAVRQKLEHVPRRWAFTPKNGYGDASNIGGPGEAEIR
jgi:hypothetical protein